MVPELIPLSFVAVLRAHGGHERARSAVGVGIASVGFVRVLCDHVWRWFFLGLFTCRCALHLTWEQKERNKTKHKAEKESQATRARASFFTRASFAGSKPKAAAVDEDIENTDAADDEVMDDQAAGTLTSDWKFLSEPNVRLRNLREVAVLGRGAFGVVRHG